MAKNLTSLHKQVTTVQSKLEALDKQVTEQGETLLDIRQQTRLMSRLVSLMTQLRGADQERLEHIAQMQRDTALMTGENLKLTRGIAERLLERRQGTSCQAQSLP